MIILSIRTDNPQAELGLFEDTNKIGYIKWQAHRELSGTIHKQIQKLLSDNQKDWADIKGVVLCEGPGSFTGLRIGFSVGNALAHANQIPVVASGGETWLDFGTKRLLGGENDKIATPNYGAPAKTTKPRK